MNIEREYPCQWASDAGVETIEVRIKAKFHFKPIYDVESKVYCRLWTKDNIEVELSELEMDEIAELNRFLEKLPIDEIISSDRSELDPDRFYDAKRCEEVS